MENSTLGAIATILTAVASITTATYGLLKFYFRQQTKLELARASANKANMELLSIDLANTRNEYREVIEKLDFMISTYKDQKVAAEKVYLALGQFVMEVKEKFKKYDAHQSPEAYNKVEVKEEPQPSTFGKVKVKE